MRNRREELQYIKGMLEIPAEIAEEALTDIDNMLEEEAAYRAGYTYGAFKALYRDVVAVLGHIDEVL